MSLQKGLGQLALRVADKKCFLSLCPLFESGAHNMKIIEFQEVNEEKEIDREYFWQ
jgi:hypothetical protein